MSIDFEAIGQAYGVAPEVVELIVKAAQVDRRSAMGAGSLPPGWTWQEEDPGMFKLENHKVGGTFLKTPAGHDISLGALFYRFVSDVLTDRTAASGAGGQKGGA